jgi:alpha-L-fucosidase
MDFNGEAIYGTSSSPFKQALPWGYCTRKATANTVVLYLHVFDPPKDGKLVLPELKNKVQSARLLAGGMGFKTTLEPQGLVVQMAAAPPPARISFTVALTLKGRIEQ